jgi:hypothetical protein
MGETKAAVFVLAMLAGMGIHALLERKPDGAPISVAP